MLLGPEHTLVLNLQWHPRHLQNKGSQPALSTRLPPSPPKATFTATVPFPSLSMLRFFCFFLTKMLNIHYYRNQPLLVKSPTFWNQKNEEARFTMFIEHLLRASCREPSLIISTVITLLPAPSAHKALLIICGTSSHVIFNFIRIYVLSDEILSNLRVGMVSPSLITSVISEAVRQEEILWTERNLSSARPKVLD